MKYILSILFTLFSICSVLAEVDQDSLNTQWDRANTAYINSDYIKAITIYDSIVESGYVSDKLYYNLANAHFKSGNIGKSMLNYNRALQLSPSDEEIKYNMQIVGAYVKDNIQQVPEIFIVKAFRSIRSSLSSNSWAFLSLLMLVLTMALTLCYLLLNRLRFRKIGFFGAFISLFCFVMFTTFSYRVKQDVINSNKAIIMNSAVSAKSSPDQSSKELFVLHEGTKVKVISTLNGWAEIRISDGNQGWVSKKSIEVI